MGQADKHDLLLPLQDKLTTEVLDDLQKQSVGPSFNSYYYGDKLYALPIDAAAQVAVSRGEKLAELGVQPPKTRTQLFEFYKQLPSEFSVAWPLCATDIWCSFLTLSAQDAGAEFINDGHIDTQVAVNTLDEIKRHLDYLHPESINWNPIKTLDSMSDYEGVVYAPYLFGYTNYSRQGFAKYRLNFTNSPNNPIRATSTIMGGVGLAVSAKTEHAQLAVEYLAFVASAEMQKTLFTAKGGQPGNLVAWQCEHNNALCGDFFDNTLSTMQNAYVRPNHPGWNHFQELGAELIHQGVVDNTASRTIVDELNQLYRTITNY